MVQDLHSSFVREYKVAPCPGSELAGLIYRLERAVEQPDPQSIADSVREALIDAMRADSSFIPDRFLQPDEVHYARRLIYMGADTRFSLLAMVWAPGQTTPLHDHGGQWCVECVYRGEIVNTSYVLEDQRNDEFYFRECKSVREVAGQSSALVPPFDHHVLSNQSDTTAVTLHVYANELLTCHMYEPAHDGGFYRKSSRLAYTA
jgi:3-mercaptopropionate dioxygenase